MPRIDNEVYVIWFLFNFKISKNIDTKLVVVFKILVAQIIIPLRFCSLQSNNRSTEKTHNPDFLKFFRSGIRKKAAKISADPTYAGHKLIRLSQDVSLLSAHTSTVYLCHFIRVFPFVKIMSVQIVTEKSFVCVFLPIYFCLKCFH